MPERNNSLSDAVADALKRHQRNEEETIKAKKKLSLIQQIAAQAQQMLHTQEIDDDKDGK